MIMITAEEFFLQNNGQHQSTSKMMIAFAQMHVTEALRQASEKVIMYDANDIDDPELDESGMAYEYYIVDKNSILNAYPLTNIK
jgi:hypothetical protein